MLRNRKKNDYVQLNCIENDGWVDHFQKLYRPTSREKDTDTETKRDIHLTNHISQEEVEQIVN